MLRVSCVAVLASWLFVFVAFAPERHAYAQEPGPAEPPAGPLDTQLFLPTAAPGLGFTVDRPQVLRHRTFVVGLGGNTALDVLERTSDDVAIQSMRTQLDLMFAIGLFEWMQFEAVLPLNIARTTDAPFAVPLERETAVGLADARVGAKVPIIRGEFSMSARALITIPTGDGDRLLGAGYWTFTPSLLFSYQTGSLGIGGEAGYRMRRREALGALEYDDELHLAPALQYRIADPISLIVEAQARIGVTGRTRQREEHPLEVDAGARITLVDGLTMDVGAGTGVIAGYGAPKLRLFAIFRYTNEDEPCAAGPEDYDGYLDGDFCAEPDNDGDGVLDVDDICPNDVEDPDGFLDEDGCPDWDNDADGVHDDDEACPLDSEDRDGFQDEDGCPEADNDEDGIEDGHDACAMEPEDLDGYQDDDGCPEPGPHEVVVTVTDSRILISERIYFDFGEETIRPVSLGILDRVARVIQRLPSGRRVRVDGFTDSEGDADYNLDLSFRRARSVVEYLVSQGVARDRLEYRGYGEEHPVAPNDSPEGRSLNRRVEFTIIEPEDSARPPASARRRRRRR